MNRLKVLIIILFVVLITSYTFFTIKYFSLVGKIEQIERRQQINSDVLSFTRLFVDKVLNGSKEVSFEDRLELENAIRALKDEKAFDCWEKFTKAKDQAEVQNNFYELFRLLLMKIK